MLENRFKVLVVEDSRMFSQVLQNRIESTGLFDVVCAHNLEETIQAVSQSAASYFVAILDLNLPDAQEGQVVDYVRSLEIPVVVFTGEFDEDRREDILAKKVIDYVFKESSSSMHYVIHLLERLYKNRFTKVLVVEDSTSARQHIRSLLERQMFQVVEAADGQKALEVMAQHPDIRMILTDYSMPVMDGFQLTKKVRTLKGRDEIVIIGISAHGNNLLSAKFIKNGANDFLTKPFLNEEFFCRISQNIDNLENVIALKQAAIRDFLTGLYNRRYFFDAGRKLLASAKRGHIRLVVAMLDIDHFKSINDTYGHDMGDEVIRRVTRIIEIHFRDSDIVARFGGEEFAVMAVNMDPDKIPEIFDQLRHFIATEEIQAEDGSLIHTSISIGVACEFEENLDLMVATADRMLYLAKNAGRNLVVIHSQDTPGGLQIEPMFP